MNVWPRSCVQAGHTDRAASLASIDRFKKLATNLEATVIIQHDQRDVGGRPIEG